MGFFKKFGKGLKRSFTKIGKGIKSGARQVGKAIDKVGKFGESVGFVAPIKPPEELIKEAKARGGKKQSFGKQVLSGFTDQGTRTFKNIQAPTKLIKKIDPLRNTGIGKAGFSPIGLAADIITAPITSIGVMGQALVDKERQKKIKSGDFDTIADLALAPVAFVGTGVASGASKAIGRGLVKAGLKSGAKTVAKTAATTATKAAAPTATRGITKIAPKSQAMKIAGKFDESTIKFKPISEIPKTTKVPKQALTKAQRLKQAKQALKSGERILKQF